MHECLSNLRKIKQGETGVGEEYWKRLKEAVFCCGNVQIEDERNTLYTDELSDAIRTVVARYLESIHRRRLTFESLTHLLSRKTKHISLKRVTLRKAVKFKPMTLVAVAEADIMAACSFLYTNMKAQNNRSFRTR